MARLRKARRFIGAIVLLVCILQSASCANSHAKSDVGALDIALQPFESDEYGDLHSIIVIQDGKVLAEKYFGDEDPDKVVDVRSAGKSITSLLVGIALDRGLINDVDEPVRDYWPEATSSAVGPIPLRHILDMRSGLEADDDVDGLAGNEDLMDESSDPLAFALGVPAIEPPGRTFRYNSLNAYVAGIVVSRAAGRSLEDFARENLFRPLGIGRWEWQEDRAGVTKGQGNLFLTARGFARIGELVLNRGTHNGQLIVSAEWIDRSLAAGVDISDADPFAHSYGHFWYRKSYPIAGSNVDVHFASGNGGNKIYVMPDLNLVVSVMSTAYGQGRGQRRSEAILKAVLAELGPQSTK